MILEGTLITRILKKRGRLRQAYSTYVTKKMKKDLADLYNGNFKYIDKSKTTNITISLTSYNKRLPVLPLALMSLLRQTLLPEKIIVWLTAEDMESFKQTDFFKNSPPLIDYRVSEDYRSHKKWLPVLLYTEIDKFVICDDDIYYPSGWLKGLLNEDFKGEIGGRCHRMLLDNEALSSYNDWDQELFGSKRNFGHDIFPTGAGGAIITRQHIPELFWDYELIKKLCPLSDDTWLKFAHLSSDILIKKSNYNFPCIEFEDSQEGSLTSVNVDQGMNDIQIRDSREYFNTDFKHLFD